MDYDIARYEIIKYLPVSSILHLCATDKFYNKICQDNSLWIYLLQRDFRFDYNETKLYPCIYNGKNAYDIFMDKYKESQLLKLNYSSILEKCKIDISYKQICTSLFLSKLLDRDFPRILCDTEISEEFDELEISEFDDTWKEIYEYAVEMMNSYFKLINPHKCFSTITMSEQNAFLLSKKYFDKEIRYLIMDVLNWLPDEIYEVLLDSNHAFFVYLMKEFPQTLYEDIRLTNQYDDLIEYITDEYEIYLEN